jgi:CRP-like cAMP-binding protein
MSRSDVAAFIGHSLEAVSRATSELKAEGIIAFQGAHLVRVLDPVRLDKLANDL